MTQQTLFGEVREASFDGKTFEPALDQNRLNRQLRLVLELMRDGNWRTLPQISLCTGQPEASVSARLRDLRKKRFGAWKVDRLRVPGFKGLWEYRVREP